MNKTFSKIKDFFVCHKLQFLVVGIIFIMFNVMLLINGAFPYGEKTLLISDSFSQIGILFEHIFDWFAGETSLFFNVKLGGGAEIFSMLLYIVLNPFYLIELPFGKANIYKSFNFVVFALLIFVAMVAMWFIKKHFKNMKKSMWVILTFVYTFSSFMVVNLSMLSWLILPAIILIIFDRFIALENDGKFIGFALSVFWLVVSSFVVGVAANILLLIVFVLHIFLIKEKEEQKEIFVKLLVSYIVAVLLSVCVMLPALLAILGTSRAGSLFSAVFRDEFSGEIMHKLACLSLDVLLVTLAAFYLTKADKKSKEFKFWLISFAVVLVPSVFDASLELMFGGYYSGFPARLQFLSVAIMFVMACKLFNENNPLQKQENEEKSSKLFFGLYVFMLVLFGVAIIFFAGFQLQKIAMGIKDPAGASNKLHRAVVLIAVVLEILLLAVILGEKRKVLSKKVFRFALYMMIIFSLGSNVVLFTVATNSDMKDMKSLSVLLSDEKIDGKLKIKQCEVGSVSLYNKVYSQGTLNYFSSTIPAEKSAISNLGYYRSPVSTLTENGTIIADSLAGLKYLVTSSKKDRPYLKYVKQTDKFYVYENTLATSGALLFNRDVTLNKNDILKSFSELAIELGINEPLFSEISVKIEEVKVDKLYAKNLYKCTATAENEGVLYLENMCLHEQFNELNKKYISKKVNSNNIYSCEVFSVGQTDVGYAKAGEEIVTYLMDIEELDDVKFTFLNYSAAEKLCQKLQERQVEFEYAKNGYKVHGNSNGEQKLVVFMLNISGMNYSLNGEDISAKSMLDGFVSINTENGEFELVAKYQYPNKTIWIVTIIVCLVLLAAVLIVYKFTGFKHIKTLTRYLFISLGAIMLSVFVFFGIVLTFFKLIL